MPSAYGIGTMAKKHTLFRFSESIGPSVWQVCYWREGYAIRRYKAFPRSRQPVFIDLNSLPPTDADAYELTRLPPVGASHRRFYSPAPHRLKALRAVQPFLSNSKPMSKSSKGKRRAFRLRAFLRA
jgi:4-alpha-glucanotransferase